ncbi:MAG: diflavin flavoprotein [Thermostichales cyanobacterium BF4_bins_65]
MTATPLTRRLSTQTERIAEDTTAIRSLDWDRDRFDIEFGLRNGTTYNSFLIRGDEVALIDSSHAKFRRLYLEALQGQIDPRQIRYLIISHTEPDHSGLTGDLLELNPDLVVVGSKVALQFLADLVHRPFAQKVIKNGDQLDLGQGHVLEFVMAPNLHWPDTIFTYDHGTQILYTCDAFGMHYCSDRVFDENLEEIESDFRFYYDCLMGPNARSVLSALKRMEQLPPIGMIATGHGPLLQYHLPEWTERYRTWSQNQAKAETTVAVLYISDYGYSDRLSQAIARGITKTGVAVEMADLRFCEAQELRELVEAVAGVVMVTPPASGELAGKLQGALGTVLGAIHPGQVFGIYESGSGEDQPSYPLQSRFQDLGLTLAFPVIRVRQLAGMNASIYQLCEEAGTDLGQRLTKARTIKQMKSLDSDLDKAMGRLSGGLYVVTARKAGASSAMLASWVMPASQNPPGITIAVAKDRAIESFLQVEDKFVLNVLEEGKHLHLMKHFLTFFPPGADRFAGIKTQTASNGSPILSEALAYLECQVQSRLELSDHWLIYATVSDGRVANPDGTPAVHHRKVGNHY